MTLSNPSEMEKYFRKLHFHRIGTAISFEDTRNKWSLFEILVILQLDSTLIWTTKIVPFNRFRFFQDFFIAKKGNLQPHFAGH